MQTQDNGTGFTDATTLPPYKCECGETFTSNYCPNCGAFRKEEKTFTCDCGYTGPALNFCPDCGRKINGNTAPAAMFQPSAAQVQVPAAAAKTPAAATAPAAPAEPDNKLGWKCQKCGAENQEDKCAVCGADIIPVFLFTVTTFLSANPPVTTGASVSEYSDTQLIFDNNGNRRLISKDVIEPAMEIIRKNRLNDPDFKDPMPIMGGDVCVGFKDGDSFRVTSLQEQGFAVTAAQNELMDLFNSAE